MALSMVTRFITFIVANALVFAQIAVLPLLAQTEKTPSTVFSNNQSITINTASGLTAPTMAATYPSTVNVSGMAGTVTKVEVTLSGVTHTRLTDLDYLLVSPTGAKFIFLSDAGGTVAVEDRVYNIRDDAPATMSASLDQPSGSYKPTSGDSVADTFPAPAPAGPYNQPPSATFASTFNGADPNGTWSLYVADDTIGSPGSINSGWTLTVTTNAAPVTFTNNAYIAINDITAQSTPYGTPITVSGLTGVISHLSVTLTGLSHTAPNDIDILLVNPAGKGLILMSDAGGTTAASNANLTFDDSAPTTINTVVTGTYKPTDIISESLDTFSAPAPLRPYLTTGSNQLSNFNGSPANGDWRLFVMDDSQGNAGSISGGWSIDITTGPAGPPPPLSCFLPAFTPTNFAAGVNPTNVAVADFNNDNKPDLAVTNQVSNDVSILLGNGYGTFGSQSFITVGSSPYAIAAGKFNADNNWDLAVVNSGSNTVSILLGNGNGTFSAPVNFFVGSSPISIAVGDVNNDSKQDLVVANFGGFFSGSVSVLLGNGSGGFVAGNSVRTRTQPAFVLMTNLNGDANKDLVIANFGSDSVSTYFGLGNGTFQLNQNVAVGSGPVAVEIPAAVDVNGFRTLLAANYNGDSVTSCSVSPAGTVSSCFTNVGYGPNPVSLTSADYLGSGAITFATALSGTNVVRFGTLTNVTVGQNPNALKTADFNNDGKPDMVSVNSGSNDVSVMINSCQVAKGNIIDYNGDRRTDYAVFRPSNSSWYIQTLNGSGAFKSFARPTDTLVPADYDGDRLADLAYFRPESGLWFAIDQYSRPIHFLQFGMVGDIPAPADYDGDIKADIAVFRPSEGKWYIRRSSDLSLQVVPWGMAGDKPVPADYDGDGKDDIAVYRPSTGVWYILRSSDGQPFIRSFGIGEDRTVQGDYDGDGKADIAVWRPSTGVWYVLRSSDGDFRAFAFGSSGDMPLIGDFEGDGKYDYAVWRPSDGGWYVWKSSDNSASFFPWGMTGDIPLPSAYVR